VTVGDRPIFFFGGYGEYGLAAKKKWLNVSKMLPRTLVTPFENKEDEEFAEHFLNRLNLMQAADYYGRKQQALMVSFDEPQRSGSRASSTSTLPQARSSSAGSWASSAASSSSGSRSLLSSLSPSSVSASSCDSYYYELPDRTREIVDGVRRSQPGLSKVEVLHSLSRGMIPRDATLTLKELIQSARRNNDAYFAKREQKVEGEIQRGQCGMEGQGGRKEEDKKPLPYKLKHDDYTREHGKHGERPGVPLTQWRIREIEENKAKDHRASTTGSKQGDEAAKIARERQLVDEMTRKMHDMIVFSNQRTVDEFVSVEPSSSKAPSSSKLGSSSSSSHAALLTRIQENNNRIRKLSHKSGGGGGRKKVGIEPVANSSRRRVGTVP